MEKDYSKNPETLEKLGKIVENGSPLQHFVVGQMGKIIKEEANARDRGEYELKQKEGVPQTQIRRGTFLLQTQNGKFLYASLGDEGNTIVLPFGTLPIPEFSKIVREALPGYRPVEPEDYNYVYIQGQGDMKPTPELLVKDGKRMTLISKESILSDVTYQGHEKSNWGRVEIDIVEQSSSHGDMDVVFLTGEYIHYSFLRGALAVEANSYDLSWDGSPDKDKELYSQRGKYGARAYSAVKNKEEMKRLIPQFWQIIRQVIGDDKIIAISTKPGGWLSLTLGEARRQYKDVRRVTSINYLVFEGVKPKPSGYEGEGFPIYYFPMGDNEVGLLIDRSGSAYMIPYLFSKTKWHEKGVGIEELETASD